MNWRVGDIVQTPLYEGSLLYRIKCFVDRVGPKCASCQSAEENPACPDDVHLVVIWKFHKALAASWRVGESVVVPARDIQEPTANEMTVLALEVA